MMKGNTTIFLQAQIVQHESCIALCVANDDTDKDMSWPVVLFQHRCDTNVYGLTEG